MKFNSIERLKSLFDDSQNFVILSHTNPDGDAVGSSLALYILLKQHFSKVNVILPDKFPDFLNWMPKSDEIYIHKDDENRCNGLIENADIIFCLDFNHPDRLNTLSEILKKAKAKRVLIDHHILPDSTCDFIYSYTSASSTAELLYEFICELGYKSNINKEVAECLYVGICTDTGSFSFSCNNSITYKITADLIEKGVDAAEIHNSIYDNFSEDRMRLLGYCLSEKLKVFNEFSSSYIFLTKEEMDKFNYQIGDTEGIVNYALAIKGIIFTVLFLEKDGFIRASFRSKGDFSANDFARKHFNGGGHKNAAGGNSYVSMEETIKNFERYLPLYKDELNKK
ncbi:MAG: bifunctional oligoribonuclease/PAP phosphatase NrnA [Saprospiraceae bacterium]|nr:bifunctional oligoribonuclease/PAP phosphatase NrnA [Saprospiraceae bacterium]